MNYGIFNICCEFSSQKHLKNLLPWANITKTRNLEISSQYGLLINFNKNFFILTNSHGIPHKNTIDTIFFEFIFNNNINKIELNLKKSIPELDITILSFKNKLDLNIILKKYKIVDSSMFSKKINLNHDDVFIYDKDYNIINMELYSMNQGKYFPYQYSDNLYYSINIKNVKFDNIRNINDQLNGLSGYPIFQKDNSDEKIVGIVNAISYDDNDNKILYVIPSIYILRILNELINYNTFQGICGLYFNYEIVSKKNIPNYITNQFNKLNYLVVTNTLGISYNYYNNVLKNKKLNNIKKSDIIIEIDDKPLINDDIFISDYNMNLNLIIYNNLNKTIFDKTKLKIIRKNKNNIYEIKLIEIYNRNLFSIKSIIHNPVTKFFNYKDNIFIELNKNILNYLIENNEISSGDFEIFDNNISNNNILKTIILFSISDKWTLDFPCKYLILHSINEKIIFNIDYIKKYKLNESNIFKFKCIINNKILEFNL